MAEDFASATTAPAPPGTELSTPQFDPTGQQTNSTAVAAPVDINSLDQFNDVEQIDADASIYDSTPPPPDGWHPVKLSVVKDGIAEKSRIGGEQFQNALGYFKFFDRDGKEQKHLMLVVDFQIAADGKPFNKQSTRQWVNTMKSGETTAVDTLLRVLTGQAGIGLANNQKMTKLYQAIVAEPVILAKTRWILQATEASPVLDKGGKQKLKQSGAEKTEFKIFKYGMNSFPVETDGNGNPKLAADGSKRHRIMEEDPETGAAARTKFEIVDMRPLSAGAGAK